MRKQIIVILLGSLFLISCPETFDPSYDISGQFYNNSEDTLLIYISKGVYSFSHFPDTLLPKDSITEHPYMNYISDFLYDYQYPPKTKRFWGVLMWSEEYHNRTERDSFSVFFISKDTLKKYGYDDVRSNYRIAVRYDLGGLGVYGHFTNLYYPPNDSMRNVKMWPPYSHFVEHYKHVEGFYSTREE